MKGQLSLNGWVYGRAKQIRPGLFSTHYRHEVTKWTAEELFTGRHNQRVGLLVRDEKGNSVGLVQSIKELP
jgi:hypothetical protein